MIYRYVVLVAFIMLSGLMLGCDAFSTGGHVKVNSFKAPSRSFRPMMSMSVSPLKEMEQQITGKLMGSTQEGTTARQFAEIFADFLSQYTDCCEVYGMDVQTYGNLTQSFLKFVDEAFKNPHQFDLYHRAIRDPFDYYAWGNDFFRPLVVMDKSKVFGTEQLEKIRGYINAGENVILYSNHQTEADPQVISLLLEPLGYSDLAEKVVCVAGHRVTSDPLAIPFSMGRNLLTIYSKKHMDNPPEEKEAKQTRNMATLKEAGHQMGLGGTLLWVAPSGGRDRPAPGTKDFVIAPLDPKSVDLFKVMAKGVEKQSTTHFFPLAMWTNGLVPPPDELKSTLGETRSASRAAVSLYFGEEIAVNEVKGKGKLGGIVEEQIKQDYQKLKDFHASQQ